MKAITISVVNRGFLVQGYPPRSECVPYDPPLPEFLFVYTDIEDLKKDLPSLLAPSVANEQAPKPSTEI